MERAARETWRSDVPDGAVEDGGPAEQGLDGRGDAASLRGSARLVVRVEDRLAAPGLVPRRIQIEQDLRT